MAENDIYNSELRYRSFIENLQKLTIPAKDRKLLNGGRCKYYCKNKKNLDYFKKLFGVFESKDTSYIRRCRLLQTMKVICYATEKDLAECDREEVGKIVAFMHKVYMSPKSKQDFIRDTKYMWKLLFPEKDERGRPDETVMPYIVRHLSARIDKSKEKLRNDRISWEEFEKILNYFSKEPKIQAYLFLALESLGRPQELLYIKMKDVELYDNYAKVFISEHGKEGTGFLQCIDSFPYVYKWYNQHPLKTDRNAFFFINTNGTTKKYKQLRPHNINKMLRNACSDMNIHKNITAYSLKRNGVTFRRLRGDSDVEIQHAARWTTTKQLKTYDMSKQEDAFKMELIKRGMIDTNDPSYNAFKPKIKVCVFCNKSNSVTNEACENCGRPLDRKRIREQEKLKEKSYIQIREEIDKIKSEMHHNTLNAADRFFEPNAVQDLFKMVYKLQKEIEAVKK